ncbi:hypothetical protein HPULCUR_001323 [Helicostylum pulchrum]|uniref:Peroxisomal trans-2-enoyl-CoA reductase n=1 Tax=Helicostylum pulchrum TaxID=562976 RepID=A0ABP9XMD5_9FUNG
MRVNVCSRASAYVIAKKSPVIIYVTDINDSNLSNLAQNITKTTGAECIPKRMDASSDEDIQSIIAEALKKYGRLDFYYANAGDDYQLLEGVIETEMTGALLTTIYQNPEKHKLMMRHNALERYGRPEEASIQIRNKIGAMVAFLASDEASFITEQAIKVDGGATVAFSYLPLFAEG